MPQVTMEETTLRFGAMAVGALRKAYQTKGQSAELGHDNKHYLNSVIYYCEALRLQSKAEPTKEGLRTALLSSLLFICFEAQRGNMPAALKHVSHGFSMLNELAACTELAPGLVSIAPAPPSLVQEILDCYRPLELQSRSFLGSYKKFLYPHKMGCSNQNVASDSSQRAFAAQQPNAATFPATASIGDNRQPQARPVAGSEVSTPLQGITSPPTQPSMSGQTSTSIAAGAVAATGLLSPESQSSDPETPPQHHPSPKMAPHRFTSIAPFTKNSPYFRPRQFNITTLDNLPSTFRNLEEARGYWSLVQKFTVSHLPLLTLLTSQLCLTRAVSNLDIEMKLSSVKKHPRIGNFVTESRHWLSRWIEAFEPVYKTICREATAEPRNYLSAMSLRIEYLILCIYSTIPRFSCLTAAEGLTPRYREINRLAEILLRSRPNCGFAMDSGWTWPLFISSFSCRDPDVRQDAIRILGQYPVRNALRDSYVFRAIALRNQEAENQVIGEGTEEEQWLQLRRRELVFEDLGSSIIFRSAQKNSRSGQLAQAASFGERVYYVGRLLGVRCGAISGLRSFKDPTIASGIFLLDVLNGMKSSYVDYDLVTAGQTDEDAYMNAKLSISIARKLGATIWLVPEDICQVRSRLVTTFIERDDGLGILATSLSKCSLFGYVPSLPSGQMPAPSAVSASPSYATQAAFGGGSGWPASALPSHNTSQTRGRDLRLHGMSHGMSQTHNVPSSAASMTLPNAPSSRSGTEENNGYSTLPLPQGQYPLSPYSWTSVQSGLHLVRLRSPDWTNPGGDGTRYYQFVSGFALDPTPIYPRRGVQRFEITVTADDFSIKSGLKRTENTVAHHFKHGSLRYRLRLIRGHKTERVIDRDSWLASPSIWPAEIYLLFNDEPVYPRRGHHFHHDIPIELTDLLREGLNTIRVSLPKGPHCSSTEAGYHLAVESVVTMDHASTVDMICKGQRIGPEETCGEIQRRMQMAASDDVIVQDDCLLTDPFSASMFQIPVRGSSCKHIECFDLQTWLQTRSSKGSLSRTEPSLADGWKCPICNGDAAPPNLRVDEYLVDVERALKLAGQVRTRSISAHVIGMNVIWGVALSILLFVLWYCHKRGRQVRLEGERTVDGSDRIEELPDNLALPAPEDVRAVGALAGQEHEEVRETVEARRQKRREGLRRGVLEWGY
ncbi:hypothetical protein E4U57_006827, partial [Claviceps arundinis]